MGVVYKRNPDAGQRANRVYFASPRGSGRSLLHRDIYEDGVGPIPDGMVIHHIDHDPFNNDIDNLRPVTRQEHAAEHPEVTGPTPEHMARIRELAKEWHRSEEGRSWHRVHAREVWDNLEPVATGRACEWCGQPVVTLVPGKDPRFCSRRCGRAEADSRHVYEVRVPCPICGTEFWQNKYRPVPLTCSRPCGAKMAWRSR